MISQAVFCPRCGALQEDFEIVSGELVLISRPAARVTGYVCTACERAIHWQRPRRKTVRPHRFVFGYEKVDDI